MIVKIYLDERERFYESGELSLDLGVEVVVEHDERLRVGKVVGKAPYFPCHKLKETLNSVVRVATSGDLDRVRRTSEREEDTRHLAARLAVERNLPMKIVRVRSSSDGKKLTVFFAAEERVDFRELVRELSHRARARIEMKQIGARDEAAITGPGLGSCGRTLCCKSWLPSFHPVTMKMAKQQRLSLNSSKITGACGRLKCCLAYEYPIYCDLVRRLPKIGQPVDTPRGPGIVQEQDILSEVVTVRLETGERLRVTLEEIMQIATARYRESNGGQLCHACGEESGNGGCCSEGRDQEGFRSNSMADEERHEDGPGLTEP